MGAVWTNDDSIGNMLAGMAGNFSGQNQANMANTVEDIKRKRRIAQAEEDVKGAYRGYQDTQKPTDLSVPLPPELGGTIALNVPTAQWTDPQGTYNAERKLGQANFSLGALHATSMGDVAQNASKLQALDQLNTTGMPTSPTALATMQTQLKGEVPATAMATPLQDDATMRQEMARLQAKTDAGLPLSNAEIINGQQIAKSQFGVTQKEGVDENGKPTTFTIGNPPTPGYEKFAAAVGWNGGAGSSAARDPTKTTPPPSVGGGPAGPVVAGPAPPGPSAFSQGAQPITQTPPPAAAATPGASALPAAVTGPAGVPIAVPPGAPAANAPQQQPIVPPRGGGGVIGSTSYGNANPKDLRTEYEARPAVKQYLIAYDAAQAAYAALKNGSPEADKVALAKLEQAVQASASAGGSQFTPHNQSGEGIGALIRDAKVALVGAGQLSDEQRRSIAAETVKQANVAYERASQETERFRVMARNGGIQNPDVVAPQLPPPPKYDPGRIAKPGTHLAPGPAKTSGAAPKSNLSDVDAIVGLGR